MESRTRAGAVDRRRLVGATALITVAAELGIFRTAQGRDRRSAFPDGIREQAGPRYGVRRSEAG